MGRPKKNNPTYVTHEELEAVKDAVKKVAIDMCDLVLVLNEALKEKSDDERKENRQG